MKLTLNAVTIAHYDAALQKGSTGSLNSMFEVAVRRAISRSRREILFTEKAGKVDIRIGRTCKVEIKTCSGEVGNDADPLAEIHAAHYIFYTPELPDRDTIESNSEKCLNTCYVFTPEEFVEMLCYIHRDGTPHIKRNSNGRWNIQTLQTFNRKTGKWSRKPLEKFYDYVDEHSIPNATLELIDSLRK